MRLLSLAAVLACLSFAACSDRENPTQGNQGDQPDTGTVQTANPSTLESTGPSQTVTTTGP